MSDTKTPRKLDIKDIESVLSLMIEKDVESFTLGDLTVKFSPRMQSQPITTVDPKEATAFLKETLLRANKNEEEDLLWSTSR